MNKLIKSAIATAAGITLLLGGAGTFAQWNSNIAVSAGAVTSGTLSIARSGNPVWTDVSAGTPARVVDLSTFRMVPGDTLELVQLVRIDATGANLKANLRLDLSGISATPDWNLAESFLSTFTATSTDTAVTRVDAWTFAVAPTTSTSMVTLTGRLTLPVDPAKAAQTRSLNLTGLTVVLTQTR